MEDVFYSAGGSTNPNSPGQRFGRLVFLFLTSHPPLSQAQSFCQSKKMEMVSLDDSEKTEHLMAVLAEDSQPFFWTGGLLDEHKL